MLYVEANSCGREGYDVLSYSHERLDQMPRSKIAITLDEQTLKRLDRLVAKDAYTSRSRAIEEAISEKLERLERTRLARESAKLDPDFEKAIAEEGLSQDLEEWPEY